MAEPIPPSAQSSSYSLTTLSSQVSTDRRAVTDINRKTRTLRCAPFLCRLRRRECCMLGAPSSQPTVPLNELPPVRLVIHRQTSAHERRKWTRSVQSRSGILVYLCTRQHWLWITVELHIFGARHEEAVAWEGGRYAPVRQVLGSEPLSLSTHRRRGRSRPLRSAVVEYQTPSVAVWLQLCTRTGLASGHSRHPVMQGLPPAHRTLRPCLRTTGQIWHGTLFPQGAMSSRSNRLLGPETRPCVQSKSHSYSMSLFQVPILAFLCRNLDYKSYSINQSCPM